jgi:hypothetical protein
MAIRIRLGTKGSARIALMVRFKSQLADQLQNSAFVRSP